MNDTDIAAALRQIENGAALPAAIEHDLEDRGLIADDGGPYATLTSDGRHFLLAASRCVAATAAEGKR